MDYEVFKKIIIDSQVNFKKSPLLISLLFWGSVLFVFFLPVVTLHEYFRSIRDRVFMSLFLVSLMEITLASLFSTIYISYVSAIITNKRNRILHEIFKIKNIFGNVIYYLFLLLIYLIIGVGLGVLLTIYVSSKDEYILEIYLLITVLVFLLNSLIFLMPGVLIIGNKSIILSLKKTLGIFFSKPLEVLFVYLFLIILSISGILILGVGVLFTIPFSHVVYLEYVQYSLEDDDSRKKNKGLEDPVY